MADTMETNSCSSFNSTEYDEEDPGTSSRSLFKDFTPYVNDIKCAEQDKNKSGWALKLINNTVSNLSVNLRNEAENESKVRRRSSLSMGGFNLRGETDSDPATRRKDDDGDSKSSRRSKNMLRNGALKKRTKSKRDITAPPVDISNSNEDDASSKGEQQTIHNRRGSFPRQTEFLLKKNLDVGNKRGSLDSKLETKRIETENHNTQNDSSTTGTSSRFGRLSATGISKRSLFLEGSKRNVLSDSKKTSMNGASLRSSLSKKISQRGGFFSN